jgi:hypothetical protein
MSAGKYAPIFPSRRSPSLPFIHPTDRLHSSGASITRHVLRADAPGLPPKYQHGLSHLKLASQQLPKRLACNEGVSRALTTWISNDYLRVSTTARLIPTTL